MGLGEEDVRTVYRVGRRGASAGMGLGVPGWVVEGFAAGRLLLVCCVRASAGAVGGAVGRLWWVCRRVFGWWIEGALVEVEGRRPWRCSRKVRSGLRMPWLWECMQMFCSLSIRVLIYGLAALPYP